MSIARHPAGLDLRWTLWRQWSSYSDCLLDVWMLGYGPGAPLQHVQPARPDEPHIKREQSGEQSYQSDI